MQHGTVPNETVQVTFRPPNNQTIICNVNPNDKIINMMAPLAKALALPPQAFKLIYAGCELNLMETGAANNFASVTLIRVIPYPICPLYKLMLETQSNTPTPSPAEVAEDMIVHAMEKTMAITLLPRHLLPILRAYYEDPKHALDEKKVDVPADYAPKTSTTTHALINELKQTHAKTKMAIVKQNTPLTDTIIDHVLKRYDDSIDSSQIDLICKMMSPNRLNKITLSNIARTKIVSYFLDALDFTEAHPNRRPIDDTLAFVALFATYEAFAVEIREVLKHTKFKPHEKTIAQLTTLLNDSLLKDFDNDHLPVIGNTNNFMAQVLTHLSRTLRRLPKEFAALHPVIHQFENELKANNAGPSSLSSLSSTLSVAPAALVADVEEKTIVFLKLKILTCDLNTTCHKSAGNIIFRSTGPNCPDLAMITHELANQLNQEFKIPSALAFKHQHMGQPADNIIVSSMEIALGAKSLITPDQVYFEVSINPNTIANYIHSVTAMPSAAAIATSMANVLQQSNAVIAIASRPINVNHSVARKRK